MAATSSSASKHIALAKALPTNLLRFFARYPPTQLFSSAEEAKAHQTSFQLSTKNPFKPQKHHVTGNWNNPVYSNRRQADLIKLAKQHGLEDLLPHSSKKTEVKLTKKVALGWRGKGTGVGQTVKGHKHERMLGAKMDKRREAMLKMPALIREWKAVGRKNWTKWPK
ncbi:54S ribosomal protein L25, mitochondrial [Gnomoniopsis sp. IMI 355080]|nr:54S ribosomal protein L25, mitochondrial [Gnomoniopsis sp. IMI 355080]